MILFASPLFLAFFAEGGGGYSINKIHDAFVTAVAISR